MTEIPEHLRKRAEEARAKAAAAKGESADAPAADAAPSEAEQDPRAPPRAGQGRSGEGRWRRGPRRGWQRRGPAAAGAGTVATAAPPVAAGPGGHTQRLLTVVKSGSIQDVKAAPQDKVHVWPHLLSIEFVAALLCVGFVFVFSIFVNAPLLELADTNKTPNPSKAPWYFLGLQELLALFHPMVAGVLLPGIGLGASPWPRTSIAIPPPSRRTASSRCRCSPSS